MDSSLAHVSGVVVAAGSAVAFSALVTLHVLPTGLSPIRNAVSQYGISRYWIGYRVATIALGIAGLAAALGISASLSGTTSLVIALLVVFGLARLIISWFPMDEPGSERTSSGHAHGLIALTTFAAVAIAAARLGSLLSNTGQWHAEAKSVQALGWVLVIVALGMVFSGRTLGSVKVFGAVERLFYLAIFAFMAVVATALV
jgi:hypothetical protein